MALQKTMAKSDISFMLIKFMVCLLIKSFASIDYFLVFNLLNLVSLINRKKTLVLDLDYLLNKHLLNAICTLEEI